MIELETNIAPWVDTCLYLCYTGKQINDWGDSVHGYKVYISKGREIFAFPSEDEGRHETISFDMGQSLMVFLEYDVSRYVEGFREIAGSKCAVAERMLDSFSRHPYFTFVRLHYIERLGNYRREDVLSDAQAEELSRIPDHLIGLQNQMRELVAGALTNLPGKEKAMDRLTEYYSGKDEGKFVLGPITTYYEKVRGSGLCEILEPNSLEDILNYIIRAMVKANVFYKTCLYCGKLFIAGHSNAEYCERPTGSSGKTCRDVGSLRVYREKQKQDPVMVEYNRAYKRNYAKIRSKRMTAEEFQEWSERAREQRDAVLAGRKELDELLEMLGE